MSFEVLASTIKAALSDHDYRQIQFVWHGGEPTILPLKFYEKALYLQAKFKNPNQTVLNSIQTNGTLLDSEWAAFFKRNKFGVGVSMDGSPELHDKHRIYVSGEGSSQEVVRGIHLLEQQGVPTSVIMVVDEDTIRLGPKQILDFFISSGIKTISLLAATPLNVESQSGGENVKHYVDPQRMNEFLAGLFDVRLALGRTDIKIRELDTLEQKIRHGSSQSCQIEGGCIGHYFIVEPDGSVAHCDLFLGDEQYEFGNILDTNFKGLRLTSKMRELVDANDARVNSLRNCTEFTVCQGWCPHEAYLSKKFVRTHLEDCCGLKDLIGHIRTRIYKDAHHAHVPIVTIN